jgi:hypothetical protein
MKKVNYIAYQLITVVYIGLLISYPLLKGLKDLKINLKRCGFPSLPRVVYARFLFK